MVVSMYVRYVFVLEQGLAEQTCVCVCVHRKVEYEGEKFPR